MSTTYTENRIREALKLSKGNALKARKLITKWCAQDQRLLQGIANPHMTGIVAHAIERVTAKISRGEPAPIEEAVIHKSESEGEFGKELLKSFAMGAPAKFAQESFSAPMKKKQASQSHIDAILRLAGKKKQS